MYNLSFEPIAGYLSTHPYLLAIKGEMILLPVMMYTYKQSYLPFFSNHTNISPRQ
jgi:hypothetical protein